MASGHREIYMDHAATTPVRPEVVDAMLPWLTERYGNPSSVYRSGRRARQALDEARDVIAAAIGAEPSEIVFTSGGTEADNLALKGVAAAAAYGRHTPAQWRPRRRIITTSIEHHAVLHSAQALQRRGWPVTILPATPSGVVEVTAVEEALAQGGENGGAAKPLLVSVMYVNNEVGTVQPVEAIARRCREHGVLFHVDAVQAFGRLRVDVDEIGCDLLSLSAHKIGGPKGVGCLFVRKGTPIEAHMDGGAQERTLRAGTENVAGIVGFARAVELALRERDDEARRLEALGERLAQGIAQRIPWARRTGDGAKRLPGLVHFVFPGVDAESLLLNLDLRGIAASSGSACTSGSLEPSHVLLAMGMDRAAAMGSLRLSLGKANDESDVDAVVDVLVELTGRLRRPEEVRR